jgi:hypothetical protein
MLELITSLFQELLHPVIHLNSLYDILNGKVPPKIVPVIQEIGKASKELKIEIHYLYGNVSQKFDLKSPTIVAIQLHRYVSQWRKYEIVLSNSLQELRELIASGFLLGDSDLDKFMKEDLFYAFENVQRLLRMTESLQANDLLNQLERRRR